MCLKNTIRRIETQKSSLRELIKDTRVLNLDIAFELGNINDKKIRRINKSHYRANNPI